MKKVKLIAVLAALAAGLCLYLFLQKSSAPVETPMATVVTAAEDIRQNTVITEEMLAYLTIPAEAVQSGAATDMTQIVDKVSNSPILAGEQIQLRRLVDLVDSESITSLSYSIPAGMRAMTISVNTTNGLAGMLLPGNCVDIFVVYSVEYTAIGDAEPQVTKALQPPASVVYAGSEDESETLQTQEPPASDPETESSSETSEDAAEETVQALEGTEEPEVVISEKIASQLLMGNIPILAIEKTLDADGLSAEGTPTAYSTITLCLTPEQTQWLNLAQNVGNITLALRSAVDGEEYTMDYITMTAEQ